MVGAVRLLEEQNLPAAEFSQTRDGPRSFRLGRRQAQQHIPPQKQPAEISELRSPQGAGNLHSGHHRLCKLRPAATCFKNFQSPRSSAQHPTKPPARCRPARAARLGSYPGIDGERPNGSKPPIEQTSKRLLESGNRSPQVQHRSGGLCGRTQEICHC